ncbi:MAG: hypothetical protein HUJ80_02855 [Firmicutes bacterium]|nr:hypothetical protein [Bacillota bacterium]
MKHLVMVKWNETVADKKALQQEVYELWCRALENKEIRKIDMHVNLLNKPNRYDVMYVVELEPQDMDVWADCQPHQIWKTDYAKYVESKAIIDLDL